ncbi:MAG: hypothetical protein JW778_04885 [Candidatus Altiarchaeota archaeon]|nr:hypothetical protein [Candidatus Altiarchaeota archaeon]
MKTRILDTSGILRSDLDFSEDRFLITNDVLIELQDETAKIAVESAIMRGNIQVRDPDEEYIKEIKQAAEETGDLEKLSDADIGILALALEKKLPIITDDYNIQNVASTINLDYEKSSQEGIKKKLRWIKVCEGCGSKHSDNSLICGVCGSPLRRKATRI